MSQNQTKSPQPELANQKEVDAVSKATKTLVNSARKEDLLVLDYLREDKR